MSTVTPPLLGFVVGFLGAIPLGPLNVSVMTGAIRGRRAPTFAMAAGGSLGDFLYCCAIMLGFAGALSSLFHRTWIRLLFGAAVAAFGVWTALAGAAPLERTRPKPGGDGSEGLRERTSHATVFASFWIGLLISGLNPGLVLSWLVIAGAIRGAGWIGTGVAENLTFAASAGIGMLSWLTLLLYLLGRLRHRVPERGLQILIRGFGVLLVLLGIYCAAGVGKLP